MEKTGKMEVPRAKFNVGDVVIHQRQGYRAVVIDVDPLFQPSGHYHREAQKRLLARQCPWYRLLVDECSQETYVEEQMLKRDESPFAIDNPHINNRLVFKNHKYYPIANKH